MWYYHLFKINDSHFDGKLCCVVDKNYSVMWGNSLKVSLSKKPFRTTRTSHHNKEGTVIVLQTV